MINSTAFDYVNVLTKRLMQATKEKLYLQTIYRMWIPRAHKRKDLNFEGVLSQELGRCKHSRLIKNKIG